MLEEAWTKDTATQQHPKLLLPSKRQKCVSPMIGRTDQSLNRDWRCRLSAATAIRNCPLFLRCGLHKNIMDCFIPERCSSSSGQDFFAIRSCGKMSRPKAYSSALEMTVWINEFCTDFNHLILGSIPLKGKLN